MYIPYPFNKLPKNVYCSIKADQKDRNFWVFITIELSESKLYRSKNKK